MLRGRIVDENALGTFANDKRKAEASKIANAGTTKSGARRTALGQIKRPLQQKSVNTTARMQPQLGPSRRALKSQTSIETLSLDEDEEEQDSRSEADEDDVFTNDLEVDNHDSQETLDNESEHGLLPAWTLAEKKYLHTLASRYGGEDVEDQWDISMVAEYGDEIFEYMRSLELTMLPEATYMQSVQVDITWSARSILVDWLVQVHARFALLPETLYLTINYIDRFLSLKQVALTKLQLVGAVSLFIAAKYEEIHCPSVNEIVFMVDNGYSVDEVLKAERYLINMLSFNMGFPGPMSFLRRTSKADDYDLDTRTLAKYLLEITIMDRRLVGSPPSFLAAGAHRLARQMLGKGEWTPAHSYFSGYTPSQLDPIVKIIIEGCHDPTEHHNAIYEKYSDKKFRRSARFVDTWMQGLGR